MKVDILKAIRQFHANYGKTPRMCDVMPANGFPCSGDTIARIFGAFNNALQEAGVPLNKVYRLQKVKCHCEHCEKEFRTKSAKRFCSRRCSNQHRRRFASCLQCGNNFSGRKKTFCNFKCQYDYEHQKFIEDWKAGKLSGNVNGGRGQVSQHVRQYLREKYSNKCTRCGWHETNPVTQLVPLTVEHIDGNSENSVEHNLDLICPNCHSLTSTYGSLNRGNGRKLRHSKVAPGTVSQSLENAAPGALQ
jgi:hypothetical protein